MYRKNKCPVGHEQANTDLGMLPLAGLLLVTLGGAFWLIFIGFGLNSKAWLSDPRAGLHRLAVNGRC